MPVSSFSWSDWTTLAPLPDHWPLCFFCPASIQQAHGDHMICYVSSSRFGKMSHESKIKFGIWQNIRRYSEITLSTSSLLFHVVPITPSSFKMFTQSPMTLTFAHLRSRRRFDTCIDPSFGIFATPRLADKMQQTESWLGKNAIIPHIVWFFATGTSKNWLTQIYNGTKEPKPPFLQTTQTLQIGRFQLQKQCLQ